MRRHAGSPRQRCPTHSSLSLCAVTRRRRRAERQFRTGNTSHGAAESRANNPRCAAGRSGDDSERQRLASRRCWAIVPRQPVLARGAYSFASTVVLQAAKRGATLPPAWYHGPALKGSRVRVGKRQAIHQSELNARPSRASTSGPSAGCNQRLRPHQPCRGATFWRPAAFFHSPVSEQGDPRTLHGLPMALPQPCMTQGRDIAKKTHSNIPR